MRGVAMSLTAAASGFVVFLLSVSVIQGQDGWEVTYTSTQICAVKGSTVNIRCSYTYPSTMNGLVTKVEKRFWFTELNNGEHVDLTTMSEYSDRVQYNSKNEDCTLSISDLRERDSAVYKFRFITNHSTGKYTASPGVTLSVTGLQVQVSRLQFYESSNWAQLKCQSSCPLPGHHSYVWYKNGQNIQGQTSDSYSAYVYPADSFSCAVRGHEDFPSPSVLIQGQYGLGVTYTSTQICAVKGSTVNIPCSYTYPSTMNGLVTKVEKRFWFTELNNGEHVDLTTMSEYSGRVQYNGKNEDCTLSISDLRERDSAVYKFRFITNQGGNYVGYPGVTLSVTGLQVQVSRLQVYESSNWAQLKCQSSCPRPGHHSYVWYKNGQNIQGQTSDSYSASFYPADSFSCAVRGHEDFPSPSVYGPKLPSVSVSPSAEIVEGSSVTLTCSSDANPAAKYTWYKENVNKPLSEGPQLVFSSIRSSDSGQYYCTAENKLGMKTSQYKFIDVKYAPKLPSVSVSPSGDLMEGSSVNVTCNSDANPAANYTWYKKNLVPNPVLERLSEEPQLVFSSIRSSDSGQYYCTAENELGRRTSANISINVKYGPKRPSVSVSPSAEIVEGSSVTLTCSSDANPAANYTWYKENQTLLQGPEGRYHVTSISSQDGGNYYCKSENQHGLITSSSLSIDVQYGPKRLSVSVSPSADIVEGSSVNLTCSSDANPAANYTWYKENEDSPKASGQIFTITDFRAEHSGNYYCEAQNRRGRQNSTFHLIVVAETWKSIIIGTIPAVFLVVVWLSVFLLIRKKRTSKQLHKPGDGSDNREQFSSEERDELHYASIHFSKNRTDPVYSNIRPAGLRKHEEQDEEEDDDKVEYAAVKFNSASTPPRTRGQETGEDPAACYSTVNKTAELNRKC
ncbi:B-cell receptor CD22-like isoform X2 [Sander vitreus]